jgi:hypothetical protein
MRDHVLCSLLVVACTLTSVGAQTKPSHVPFRIVASSGTVVRVDIGARRESAASLRRATVPTPTGAVRADLVRTERVCQELCAEKECHFEAILRASAPVTDADQS